MRPIGRKFHWNESGSRVTLNHGEVSPDGEVTIDFVECLASCGTAPVVLIDDDLHEKVDCAKAKQISDQIKAEAAKRR